jgi:hypothetical protein
VETNDDIRNSQETVEDETDEDLWQERLEQLSEIASNEVTKTSDLADNCQRGQMELQHTPNQVSSIDSSPSATSHPSLRFENKQISSPIDLVTSPRSSPLYQSRSLWPLVEEEAALLRYYVVHLAPWVCSSYLLRSVRNGNRRV